MALTINHAYTATGTDAGNGEVNKARWNAALNYSGTLEIGAGGTGQTTAEAAIQALETSQFVTSAAGTTTLTAASPRNIIVTGTTTQTIVLPDVTTLALGWQYNIVNLSTGTVTVQSSGGNAFSFTQVAKAHCEYRCIAITGTGTASWAQIFTSGSGRTGFGGNIVYNNSPALTTPDLGTPSALVLTNATSLPVASITWTDLTVTPSTDQNDYNPASLSTASQLSMNIGASMKLTGLAGGTGGRPITIANTSSDYLLWLENENTSSTAANRFRLPRGLPAFLMPGDTLDLRYDSTLSRWRVVGWPSQGSAMGLTEFGDFGVQSPSSSGQPLGMFASFFSGTGSGFTTTSGTADYAINTTEKPCGVFTMRTGTTTTGRTHVGMNLRSIVWGQGPALSVARLAVQTAADGTETYTVRSGFVDDPNSGAVVNGAGWEYRWNGSAVEWSTITVAASSVTRATTSMPTPDLTYIWLICFVNANGSRVDFIWSQDSVAFTKAPSMNTGLPSAGTSTGFQIASVVKSAGTTDRFVSVDLGGSRVDYVRG